MSHSIPKTVSANQLNQEQCRKFLAGNRSCFYRGFWKNSPYEQEKKPNPRESVVKSRQGKN
ncbi:MAG: hypothetical protein CMI17_10510 [Opitutaceae bacterium]|nr:hypothetical protein [Opitutaceae bacterium]